MSWSRFILNKKVQLFIILVLTFLAYSNIFKNEFVWDDKDILPWGGQRDFGDISDFFKGDVPSGHGGVYRPIISFFYLISNRLYGDNLIGYHVQSIIIHLICTILIYFIVLKMTNKSMIAFMSSLLFGVHPIHTEAITFMTCSFDIIGVVFFFLAFYFYLQGTKIKYYLSILFALLAFFSYELTLTLPLLIILYDITTKSFRKEKIKRYVSYFVLLGVYFFIRNGILNITTNDKYLANSFYYTVLTMIKVFLKYISLLIFPVNLNVNHKISEGILSIVYGDVNLDRVLVQSLFDFQILFSILVILALIFIAFKCYKRYPLVSFSIGWFFISLIPVSDIVPRPVLLQEKYLYIPSFGFILLFSYLIYSLYKKFNYKNIRKGLIIFFILIVLIFTGLTFGRNLDWRDGITLWTDAVKKSPESVFARLNLGYVYLYEKNDTNLALFHYKKALEVNPTFPFALEKVTLLDPGYGIEKNSDEYFYRLGLNYHNKGDIKGAIEAYKKALELNPKHLRAMNNLGYDYLSIGELDLAIGMFNKALEIEPNSDFPNFNLGKVYQEKGDREKAIYYYKRALEINPDLGEARERLNQISV